MDQHTQMQYERPSVTVLEEEELLKIFQMTAAEISVFSTGAPSAVSAWVSALPP